MSLPFVPPTGPEAFGHELARLVIDLAPDHSDPSLPFPTPLAWEKILNLGGRLARLARIDPVLCDELGRSWSAAKTGDTFSTLSQLLAGDLTRLGSVAILFARLNACPTADDALSDWRIGSFDRHPSWMEPEPKLLAPRPDTNSPLSGLWNALHIMSRFSKSAHTALHADPSKSWSAYDFIHEHGIFWTWEASPPSERRARLVASTLVERVALSLAVHLAPAVRAPRL